MSKENYDTKLSSIEALSKREIRFPKKPIDIYLQESENLFIWIQKDKRELIKRGLDWNTYVLDLPIRYEACRYAQALWVKEDHDRKEAVEVWKEEAPKAYSYRSDLLADLVFVFRNNPDLLAKVCTINNRCRSIDIVQDLRDISVLGKACAVELARVKYDLRNFNIAEQKSENLTELLIRSNGDISSTSRTKELRDRAYTHLKEAVDEIRETGKYIFRKKTERHKGYCQYKNQEESLEPQWIM
ncbi:hypothetical protein [Aquimarina sediminis]|uniref:hypothetical protein n=1 Tax=Aquimarina sediminis TaxID=2070536 RepID=UPI000CA04452|nr:hypothetical protein [Aquimarina sediminis]